MLKDDLDALDAGTPSADQTQEDVVGNIRTVLALAHVLMQLSQHSRDLNEDVLPVDDLQLFELNLRIVPCNYPEQSAGWLDELLLKVQFSNQFVSFCVEQVSL